VSTPGP